MAVSSEEQLLNELLRDVRRADERLDAADLEARVVREFSVAVKRPTVRLKRRTVRLTPDTTYYLGALLAVAVVLTTLTARSASELGPLPVVQRPVHSTAAFNTPVEFPTNPLTTKSPAQQRKIGEPSMAHSSIEFVPLMPLTERELAGSFQIVRVQMPRASLGALMSPFDHPNEVVEADVLLGEDGMARAIRVSTNGSEYPRRFR
jgi:hypothetical protein